MFTVAIVLCVIILLVHYLRWSNEYWSTRRVPGPELALLFGDFKDSTLHREQLHEALKRIYDKYSTEKVVGVYRVTRPALLLRDLDIIKHVMIKDFDVFADRGFSLGRHGLAANLFMADADTWRALRHQFTPLFTSGKLRNMLPLISARGDQFLDHVEKVVRERPEQSVHVLVQRFTISTIAACAFGLDVDISNLDDPFLRQLRSIGDMVFAQSAMRELIMLYPKVFRFINQPMFSRKLGKFFDDLVAGVLTERGGAPSGRHDFMDLILELKRAGEAVEPRRAGGGISSIKITDDVIAAQAFIFYAAGYETSATTMTFMLHELARNPCIQERVHVEIDAMLRAHGGEVTYEALGQLPYMERVFDETLRKYPVLDPLQREASCDYAVPGTDVIIEKGTMVLVPVTAIHHNEVLYPQPQRFDPERFSPEEIARRHPCAYIPFGIGPRNCIGMRFAKLQSRVCMVKMLSRFRVEPAGEMVLDLSRVLPAPQRTYCLRFLPREKACRTT